VENWLTEREKFSTDNYPEGGGRPHKSSLEDRNLQLPNSKQRTDPFSEVPEVREIQVHVHDHVAALQHLRKGAASESRSENKATSAQAFVLNIHKIQFNALRAAGRGSRPTATRYMDDLPVKV
jgi:hypothetical protein